MKRFIKNLTILFLLISISMITFLLILPSDENNIYGSLNDKHQYIEKSDKNNIIILGGSNVLMGIDSELIEKRLDYSVANMGINAGIGLKFLINDIKPYIKEGDIVVIAAEYSNYVGQLNGDSALLFLFKQVPNAMKSIAVEQIPRLLQGVPYFLRGQLAGILKGMEADELHNRDNLNKNGDLISHLKLEGVDVEAGNSSFGNIDYEVFEVLNEFDTYAKSKGVKVVLSWPSLYDEVFNNWSEGINELNELVKEETTVDVISDFNDYKFTKEEIFDTIYHLNEIGRQRRTEQLIEDLKKYLDQDDSSID